MLVKVPVWSVNLCCLCPSNTTLALGRFNARSTAVSPQSSLHGGEESQGSPQLRDLKGCRSLLSGPLTLSPYLNHEQRKYYCVRESLKRLHSLSLRAGGRREFVVCKATDGLKLLCEFWVHLYICISAVPCAFLSSGTQPEAVGKTKQRESKGTHVFISKFVLSRSTECWQRSVLIHLWYEHDQWWIFHFIIPWQVWARLCQVYTNRWKFIISPNKIQTFGLAK